MALSCRLTCTGAPAGEGRLLTMSTLREEGVMGVKQAACDQLLASRVEQKMQA